MKINFYDAKLLERWQIKKLLSFTNKYLHQPDQLELSITFVGKEEIQQLNNKYRKVDRATDVLSFPMLEQDYHEPICMENQEIDYDTGRLNLGDIMICRDVAKEQASEYGHSYKREVCFLALHGYLHLVGYDHIEENDRAIMELTQKQILALSKIERK